MVSDDFDKIISRILFEARKPGPEHERLKKQLAAWAVAKGYVVEYSGFNNGAKPDVLRGTKDEKNLLVGDAKDSKNETPNNRQTVSRIRGYIEAFGDSLGTPGYEGGIITIATNSLQSAKEWVECLNILVLNAGITDSKKNKPNFKIVKIKSSKTWIVYW